MLIDPRNGVGAPSFFGGHFSPVAPSPRAIPQLAAGPTGRPCNGSTSFDPKAYIARDGDPFLSAGSRV